MDDPMMIRMVMLLVLHLCTVGAAMVTGTAGPSSSKAEHCRKYLSNCMTALPAILGPRELRGLPTTKEDLDNTCLAFTTGMNCVDNYTANCLDRDTQRWVEDTVAGAKATFRMLCGNKAYQNQYLVHSHCYRITMVTEGWNHCAERFIAILNEEMKRNNSVPEQRVMELCCARHGFIKCVKGMARHKCGSLSANFLSGIADTLASVRVQRKLCGGVNFTYCSSAAGPGASLLATLLLLLLSWTRI